MHPPEAGADGKPSQDWGIEFEEPKVLNPKP